MIDIRIDNLKKVLLTGTLFSLTLFISTRTYGGDCIPLSKYERYESHNFIAIVDIKNVGENYFEMSIIETLKGVLKSNPSRGLINEYSIKPKQGETWLLYGQLEDDNLNVDICSGSKNFHYPIAFDLEVKEPPKFNLSDETVVILEEIKKANLKNELYFEIENIREWNRKKELQSSQQDGTDKIGEDYTTLEIILTVLVALSFILNFIVLIKVKR
ncbi:hypothetical protein [Ekhidna sp.]|uniref:hypothetical protein n=1 Tax=Ekhidna sp. TaxID=2608089 RepID=UPI0032976B99